MGVGIRSFTSLRAALLVRRPPVAVFYFLRFYRPLYYSYALRGWCLAFYGFIGLSAFPTPSGGSIFRCTTKDRGERRAKGVATPFNPPELMQDRILTCFVRTFSQRCV